MSEIELKVDEIGDLPAVKFNFEDIKKELTAQMEKYKGLVVTEKTVDVAKKDRATLNKLARQINDKKIAIKKEYNEPYTKFENQVKELIELIKEPAEAIDVQVKKFEEQAKIEKQKLIQEYFDAENIYTWLTLDKIQDEKWLNAGTKSKQIVDEIKQKLHTIKNDLETLQTIESENIDALTSMYHRTMNLSECVRENTRLISIKKERERIEQTIIPASKRVVIDEPVIEHKKTEELPLATITLTVRGNINQLRDLKLFIEEQKITIVEAK